MGWHIVLIESDWNLKGKVRTVRDPASIVLIESDWNLKLEMLMNAIYVQASINRIGLEFKVKAKLTWTTRSAAVLIESDWNLKELHMDGQQVLGMVLIESDWNLRVECDS